MRPLANFTLHAMLAAALAAFAATSAAARGPGGDADSQGFFQMRLGLGAQGEQFEVQSFHWGPRQTTSADGSRTRTGNLVSLDDGNDAARGLDAGMKQLEANDKMGNAASSGAKGVGQLGDGVDPAAAHEVKSPRDTSLGSVSERRQHAPVVFPTPRDRGSLTIEGALPGCTVGKRYAGAQFASGGMRYELKDVVISNCAANGLSLDYAKVTVRGWDPAKKQD